MKPDRGHPGCPHCRCLPPDTWTDHHWHGQINRDAPFYGLVALIDQHTIANYHHTRPDKATA